MKTRDKSKLNQRKSELEDRGEETKVMEFSGIYYLYVKKEKPLK